VTAAGHDVLDLGACDATPSDYPDFALLVGRAIQEGRLTGASCCAAAASARRLPRTSCTAFAPGSVTTPTPPTRASSTTTPTSLPGAAHHRTGADR